jgi:hypothetical protein
MGAFGGLIITNKGRALQAKAQTGVRLNFTRIGVGDGNLGGQLIPDLNGLISEKKSLAITKLKTQAGGKAVVGAVLSNQEITTGFYFREIGVFAQDPDVGEILYCYGNAGSGAEYIPAGGGPDVIEKNIDIITLVGNAPNVSAVLDSSMVVVSKADFDSHVNDKNNPHNVTAAQIGAETPAGAQAKIDAHEAKPDPHPQYLLATEAPVKTVNEKSGDVVLTAADVGAETPAGAQAKVDTHKGDYVSHVPYAVATGSANAYAVTLNPAPTAYVEGMALAVKINVQNTGASTLNVNGLGAKPIKKANGNDVAAGNLKAGGIYTLRFDGVNFILQGEGGEYGTAGPAQVLTGYTIGTENGIVSGTMPNRGNVGTINLTSKGASYTIPAGYHNGNGKVVATYDEREFASGETSVNQNIGYANTEILIPIPVSFNPKHIYVSVFPDIQAGGQVPITMKLQGAIKSEGMSGLTFWVPSWQDYSGVISRVNLQLSGDKIVRLFWNGTINYYHYIEKIQWVAVG